MLLGVGGGCLFFNCKCIANSAKNVANNNESLDSYKFRRSTALPLEHSTIYRRLKMPETKKKSVSNVILNKSE